MAKKKFSLGSDQIKPLVENRGGCIATDMITVEGRKVGYMYREEPNNELDTGWRFMSGRESQAYMDDAANHEVYSVNTIANYDVDIIPFLDAPIGCAFVRQDGLPGFIQVEGEPWEAGTSAARPVKKWPPPGFPLVEGHHPLTETWSIDLPEQFARRVEERSLVLWRPGLTIWLTAWGNDNYQSRTARLTEIKKTVSKHRFGERETAEKSLTRYSYRLHEEGPVEALYAFVLGDTGQLQIAIYFDDPADEATARLLADSVAERRRTV
jgi:hypothetical protein